MFGLANLITSFNLLGGICSIIFSLSGRLDWAVYALAIAAILDFLDGFVARLTNTNGLLGKQLDSLADLVSFGVAPGILMFVMIIVGIDPRFPAFLWDKLLEQAELTINLLCQALSASHFSA